MTVAFNDIEPYETLEVLKDASPIEIKKSYKKLCLKYHPDKIQQLNQEQTDNDVFPKLQFAYSILSDPVKRQRYDQTGSLGHAEEDIDGGFNWKEYFDSMNDKITINMIEEDRNKYQGSEEEKEDIISNFIYYEGDFLKLFELVPHLEFTESEEVRVFNIIETAIKEDQSLMDKHASKSWDKYKKSRKTKVKQMLKKLAKEAKEAEELEKSIKDKGKRSIRKESDLAALIKGRQANRMDTLISSLESKYVGKSGKKRTSKDISDDEFDKIQSRLSGSKRTKK